MTAFFKVSVHRGPRHTEQVGDLLDRLDAGVVELLGKRRLVLGQPGATAADPAAGPRQGLRAGGPVEMDVLQIDARADERVDLVIGVLVRGRYPVRSRRACVGIYFGDPFLPTTRR